jgi:hypothetical protein
MKFILAILFIMLVPITGIIVSGILAMNHIEGWGWILFVSVLPLLGHYSTSKKEIEK